MANSINIESLLREAEYAIYREGFPGYCEAVPPSQEELADALSRAEKSKTDFIRIRLTFAVSDDNFGEPNYTSTSEVEITLSQIVEE